MLDPLEEMRERMNENNTLSLTLLGTENMAVGCKVTGPENRMEPEPTN